MMLASCSSNDKLDSSPTPQQPDVAAAGEIPVGFDAYTQRAVTRSGLFGDATLVTLQSPSGTGGGFGVFGYYTDNNDYDQLSTPNFMYNQLVSWNTTSNKWEYDPVKYWPNEYGANAASDDADKVSYFAYAPYVSVNVSSGKAAIQDWGITSMSRNTASGDPIIKYIGSFKAAEAVDLMWGVYNEDADNWFTNNGAAAQTFTKGTPWINVQRPQEVSQRLRFTFRHALAKMQVKVDYDADVNGHSATADLHEDTRIWIRSVRFNGFAMKGALNLNNETANRPYWMNYNGIGDLDSDGEVIVYDGRKDGKEALSDAANEKSLGLNPDFIENDKALDSANKTWAAAGAGVPTGVKKTADQLFDGGGIFYVIPTGDDMEVEIVYDVETVDGNLATTLSDNMTPGSSVENRIIKKVTFGTTDTQLQAGKAYTIMLHLGMNSVKFDAAVMDWEDMTPAEVELPSNVPFYTAATPAGAGTATIPYYETTFGIGLLGLDGGEAVTTNFDTTADWKENTATNVAAESATAFTGWAKTNAEKNATASGYAIEELTTAINPTTSNRTVTITWTGGTSGKGMAIAFTQQAHPLGLKAPADLTAAATLTLQRSADLTPGFGWFCKGLAGDCVALTTNDGTDHYIKVWRNSVELTLNTAGPAAGEFSFADTAGTITFGEPPVAGDVITVEIKTGDAAAETISFTLQ